MTDISTPDTEKYEGLSNTWRFRFEFFDRNGTPGAIKTSPAYTAAFRDLSFGKRMKLNFNWLGAVFGVFYLLYLRLWRKALVLVGLGIAIGIVSVILDLPPSIDRIVTFGFAFFIASRVNTYNYERRVLGRHTWRL
ncbi:uncharacterized protein DUF2628 [Rhodococcus sp. SMB37]|uniref:DUF2628 domain-containing protein n=1 Tax=Rhodococcus sp. SMB37 TaxID=2512213 RepID=UPI001044C52F|nr:DUF2628 domain-containing protein [Rhodococcus sp. SMB37]TCN52177.1 uncharacterized protein DUF2628 [Rhodococcus sp. SMB37]